jgi:hypothetical protein
MEIIEKFANIFDKTGNIILKFLEGANKSLKAIQCFSNILEFFSMTSKDKQKYSIFASKISEARKIFKLFKFIIEIPRLKYLVGTPMDNFTKNFNFLTRFFNAIFYVFENLSVLTDLKFLNKNYRTHIEISMSLSWLLGQIFHMSYYIGILKKTYTDEEDLRNMEVNKCKVKHIYEKLKILSKIRIYLVMGIIKNFGDFILSCYDLQLFENFLGSKTMKFIVGITGFISALISLYQMHFPDPHLK